uniref:Uncharacterized protein n=1 Tax=Lepeophtheirus salmonis TaxID=72036 RepID=A0A0K2UYL5_LEPSM
MEQSYTPMKVL